MEELTGGWKYIVRLHRLRLGLSQQALSDMLGVSQRTVSRWERGEDNPSLTQQRALRDIGWEPPGSILTTLAATVTHCPAPRALSRTQKLRLMAVSRPARAKRPSIVDSLGEDLAPRAEGVLAELLDDRPLQRAIARREIFGIETTARSVLRGPESPGIGNFRTTITYFFHEGTLYSDAVSFPAPDDTPPGYRVIAMDDAVQESLAAIRLVVDPEAPGAK